MRLAQAFVLAVWAQWGCAEPPCEIQLGSKQRFVLAGLQLPGSRSDFAGDLNGDGKLDNQLGNIIGALYQQGIPAQDFVDEAILTGRFAPTVELLSDPSIGRNVGVTFGEDQPRATFCGQVKDGTTFDSSWNGPSDQNVTLAITLPFFDDAQVTLSGARLRLDVYSSVVVTGQLNGGVSRDQVYGRVAEGIARLLTKKIIGDPNASLSNGIRSLFDNGGADESCQGACLNPDKTCGRAEDGVIQPCEVSTNSIIKNILAPDVDLFDESGAYAPNPRNEAKDVLSVGVRFTAHLIP
jgi:hypothetical protein